ncbi:PAP_fibrillin [compost metagenome]
MKTLLYSLLMVSLMSGNSWADPNKKDAVEDLKTQILQIASAAQGEYDSDDNDPAVRAQLDPLVDQLVALVPARTEAEKFVDVVGAWQQVWADGPGGPPGMGPLAADVFQVVFPDKYYWNVAKNKVRDIMTMGFLRGKFDVEADSLKIEFTKAVFDPGWVAPGTDVNTLAMRAEVGAYDGNPQTPGTSPIGKKGFLANVYVDEDMRICRGGGEEFGGTYLYILTRNTAFKLK